MAAVWASASYPVPARASRSPAAPCACCTASEIVQYVQQRIANALRVSESGDLPCLRTGH
eukprot:633453-Lingulodinium_polyedra.AAC.1